MCVGVHGPSEIPTKIPYLLPTGVHGLGWVGPGGVFPSHTQAWPGTVLEIQAQNLLPKANCKFAATDQAQRASTMSNPKPSNLVN